VDITRILFTKGANVNAQDEVGSTPLHIAVESSLSNVDITRILLENGANVDARDEYGTTPLHVAIQLNATNVVELLLEMGADPTTISETGDTPESLARRKGNPAIIDLLDNPPALKAELKQTLGRRQRRLKLSRPELDDDELAMFANFKGVLWFPRTDRQPRVCPVSDFMNQLGGETNNHFATNRWIHLPSNNVSPQSTHNISDERILLTTSLSRGGFR
jgi:hypothetical protein